MKPLHPLASLGLLLATASAAATAQAAAKPNIVFILADDLAYGDLACLGQTQFATPNLDRLAAAGMVFTNAYCGAPWCAPSRASLLTGRDGRHLAPLAKDDKGRGARFNPTVAEMLKAAGYSTCAIGKWHMYEGVDSHLFGKTFEANQAKINWSQMPWHRGFDVCRIGYFYGYNPHYPDALLCSETEIRKFPENRNVDQDYLGDPPKPKHYDAQGRFVDKQGTDATHLTYAEDVYRREALSFIRAHKDGPFFLYYATPLVHSQLAAKDIGPFLDRPGWRLVHKVYASMVQEIDRSVGEILDELKRQGLEENTLVIFASDNGYAGYTAYLGASRSTERDDPVFRNKGPWNRGKFSQANGGVTIPFIACWPGHVPHGQTARAVTFCDFMATAADLAGTNLPGPSEGVSYRRILEGHEQEQPLRPPLVWPNQFTLLQAFPDDWNPAPPAKPTRLVPNALLLDETWYALEMGREIRLFDIIADPGMKNDLSAQHPELCSRARAEFQRR